MSLPSAVAAQGARADELLQKAAAARNGNTEQPAPASPTTTASETPKETAAPATSTPSPTPAPASDAEHKLKVLKGKYDAEVPRLAAAAKAEREAREKAERELEELRKKQNSQPLVSPEEVTEFGAPLVDLARRIAREENRATVEENEKLKKRLEEVSAQVTTTAQVGASLNTNAFFSTLDAKHSDWRVVNDDPAFLAWMGETDPLYGRTRQEILDEAQNELDANRVSAFFTAFKADVQSRAAPRTEALNDQVVPSSTTSSAPAPDAGKKIWTPGLITKFYDDVRRGRYKAEEAERIERDIDAAPREGRYRQK